MSTYDWPTSRVFVPGMAELRVIDNTQRSLESPLSGYVQTISMPGARWGWGFDFPAQNIADRSALEGYLLRLSGREHRVRLWDLKRPRPLGNIATSGVTLGAAAAQFASSLALAGCRAARNLLSNPGFELDSNADGVADGWSALTSGSVGTVTRELVTAAPNTGTGGLCQRIISTALNGLVGIGQSVAVSPGVTYSLSVTQLTSPGIDLSVEMAWYASGGAYISTSVSTVAGTGTVGRRSVTGVAPAGAATASLGLYLSSTSGGLAQTYLDNVQLEVGAATEYGPATLLAGDWIGLTGGQLVRVVADATATDAGAMTVEVRHMLRSAVASGSAVTLEKPTALYVRTDSSLAMPRQPGGVEPEMSVEFVEVFA